jgi:hypothetical protein
MPLLGAVPLAKVVMVLRQGRLPATREMVFQEPLPAMQVMAMRL